MKLLVTLTAVASLFCALLECSDVSAASYQQVPEFTEVSPRNGFVLTFDELNWHDAFKACMEINMTLAFPSSPGDGENLISFLFNWSDNSTKDIHLGFHSLFFPGNFINMQGRAMDQVGYWQWDPLSENKTEHRCGALTIRGMKTIDCNTQQQSVCQFKESHDFDRIDGFGYYHLYKDWNLNWTEAVDDCITWNANLLMLNSVEEYDAIFNYYSNLGFITGGIDLLYGAHQLFADNWFLTLFDDPVEETGYDVWAPGQPIAGADFPYVGLHLTDSTTPDTEAGMYVMQMGTPMAYICKRELH